MLPGLIEKEADDGEQREQEEAAVFHDLFLSFRDLVDPAGIQGMTTHDASQRKPGAFGGAEPTNRDDRVFRARRMKPAARAEQRTDHAPIRSD